MKGTITIAGEENHGATKQTESRVKAVIFKNCAAFTDCITEIDNRRVDNIKNLVQMIPMYSLIEYRDNYSKSTGRYLLFCTDESNATIRYSESFNFKARTTGKIPDDGNVEVAVQFKYLSNYWKTLAMPLIIPKTNLILTWSANCVITNSVGVGTFAITHTKFYIRVAILSTEDNPKLF